MGEHDSLRQTLRLAGNGIVARSSKTLTETDGNVLDSPDLRTECHCERTLFELSTRGVLYCFVKLGK
jgi:hypothetical protein